MVVGVFDADALKAAMMRATPEIVIHQLTDLPHVFDEAQLAASYPRNARIRTEGTCNLIAAAKAAAARRFIVQSIAFGYAAGAEPHTEADPFDLVDGPRAVTVRGAAEMERQVLTSGLEATLLRYGFFYGPGAWHDGPTRKPPLHVDAAAHAALIALATIDAPHYAIGSRLEMEMTVEAVRKVSDLPRVSLADGPERGIVVARGRLVGPFCLLVTRWKNRH